MQVESGGGSGGAFWSGPCEAGAKRVVLGLLIVCFVLQTALVYTDEPGSSALSDQAIAGRRIFHQHNCQSCHQIYGFGGFLGPDLTNAAQRVTPERLTRLLTEGSPPMPALGLREDEIAAVAAFLQALDRTGRGQARAQRPGADLPLRYAQVVLRAVGDDAAAAAGAELFLQRGCTGCHSPFSVSPVGAPDLSTVNRRLTAEELEHVLLRGRPPRMPAPGLNDEQRAAVTRFLTWQAERRSALQGALAATAPALEWSRLPWWEYP